MSTPQHPSPSLQQFVRAFGEAANQAVAQSPLLRALVEQETRHRVALEHATAQIERGGRQAQQRENARRFRRVLARARMPR